MTTEEIDEKLTPGTSAGTGMDDDWIPCGKADGVIYRIPKSNRVVKNGVLVPLKTIKVNGKEIPDFQANSIAIQKKALRYVRRPSEEERRVPTGITLKLGITSHLGGFIDKLRAQFPFLKTETDNGFQLGHWVCGDKLGKSMMQAQTFAFLKVIPVEDGIYVIIYDPEGDIA